MTEHLNDEWAVFRKTIIKPQGCPIRLEVGHPCGFIFYRFWEYLLETSTPLNDNKDNRKFFQN
ncbi:MAG TPA: hypothetical protein DDW50_15920 [Firmicutes bacterium]|nr:hypothetical protein [Bacillota bacterium]